MSTHPYLAYQLARVRQEELLRQASLRSNQLSGRLSVGRQRRSYRHPFRRLRSAPLETHLDPALSVVP